MANLSVFNKIMKLQKVLLLSNVHNYIQPAAAAVAAERNTLALIGQRSASHYHSLVSLRPHTSLVFRQQNSNRHNSSSSSKTPSDDTDTTSIDEFRARQEKLEEEFAKNKEQQPHTTINESTSAAGTSEEDAAKRAKVDAVRLKILDASLVHVPTHGWSRKAIVQGAEDAGYPGVVHGMFPNGGFELVSHFYSKCNDELIRHLQEETNNGQKEVSNPLDFLVRAVRMRLEMIAPYKSQWPQAMALIALPQNVSTSLAQVLTLVDDICYFSGDRSVDFGWYTRRIGLATIYKMTELYMLQDSSPEHESTWVFLKNRMDEAAQIQMMMMKTEDMTQIFQRSFNSAFITARNILGVGYNRR